MDHMPVIDDMPMFAAGMSPPTGLGQLMGTAEIDFEPVIVEAHPQPVADQARGHTVEHLAQDKAAGGGHRDDGILVIGGAPTGSSCRTARSTSMRGSAVHCGVR